MRTQQDLNGNWTWHCEGESATYQGTVPGSVLSDMLTANLIEDPFWRTNEYETRELLFKNYVYTRNFIITPAQLCAGVVELVCEGLDTLAILSINGTVIAETDNMHCTYRFSVKDVLHEGENEITILFSSALRFARCEDAHNDIHYASTGSIHGNAAIRKAHYMFGWDWGPQLPDMGIFRPIYLEYTTGARLTDVHIRQFHTKAGQPVTLTVDAEIDDFGNTPYKTEVMITAPNGETQTDLVIQNPQLWWPNGLGAQPLYTVTVTLLQNDTVQDTYTCRIGLRHITVSTETDAWGSEFAFVVNGHKIFATGANYIPQDNLPTRVTPARYRQIVIDSANANMNMLRVWGGGYYPDDAFYDACDEYGILVWQDMMFACNVYALDDHFEENIIAETKDNARRLRHHASLAMWCSNNEMEWGWGDDEGRGWKRIRGHNPRYKADYLKIFEMILPRALAQYDDQTFYWPSSPSSGGAFDEPNCPDRGDQHYWEVWHSGKPFTEYRNHHFRFCSEYGFQSFPGVKTLESFTLPQDRNIFSEVMESHQKNGMANSKIFAYISDYFLYPKNLDSLAYISQILQLKAIQYGVEHWRQNRGRCMGSLYWQLNDCWPVASWASIDYYGRWKALHYGAKRFYAPVCASAREKEELSREITYYVHNDTLSEKAVSLEINLLDTNFNILHTVNQAVTASPLSATAVCTVDFTSYLQNAKQSVAQYRLLDETGQCISNGCTQFVKPKYFDYPNAQYHATIKDDGDFYTITVTANGFSNYTELYFEQVDATLSDNFFDITTADGVTVTLAKNTLSQDPGADALLHQLVIRSVADTYLREGT